MRPGPLLAVGVLALAGCADKLPVDAADHHTALPPAAAAPARTYPEPVYSVPHSATDAPVATGPSAGGNAPATPPAQPASAGPDTCGAAPLAYLIGKPRTEIPIPVDMSHRRVVCTTCPVTQDFDPARQTITYDSATNLVTRVACG